MYMDYSFVRLFSRFMAFSEAVNKKFSLDFCWALAVFISENSGDWQEAIRKKEGECLRNVSHDGLHHSF